MKHFLLVPALALPALMAGCSSSNENPDGVPATPTKTSSTTSEAPTKAQPVADTGAEAGNAAGNEAGGEANTGGKTYKVADETPGLPPEAAAALKKAALPPPPASLKLSGKPHIRLTTSQGVIEVELDPQAAPLHAKSFYYLTQKKFFDDTRFHRYVPGFVIQGGSPLSKGANYDKFNPQELVGVGGPGYQIPREFNELKHKEMVLSAARSQDPDSAGSQFYITLEPQPSLDQESAQDGVGYTVFGRVLSGQAAVLKLRQGDALKSAVILPDAKKKG